MSRPKRSDVAGAIGILGGLCGVALIAFGDISALEYLWVNEVGLVFLAAIGAWAAGWVFAPLFGTDGWAGWVLALAGAILVTGLGSAIAGTLVFPPLGTVVAPLVLVNQAFEFPMLLLSWATLMSGLHLLVLKSEGCHRYEG